MSSYYVLEDAKKSSKVVKEVLDKIIVKVEKKERKRQYDREYGKKNREKKYEANRKFRENNREQLNEKKRQYNRENKEKIAERYKKYYQNNSEKLKEKYSHRYQENRERLCEKRRNYYYQNREKELEKIREYRENNFERVKTLRRRNYRLKHNSPIPLNAPKQVTNFELRIREIVKEVFPFLTLKFNVWPRWLKRPKTGFLLELDISIPEMSIVIEAQDKGHYKYIKDYEERELDKEFLCWKNNVELIQVPYFIPDPKKFIEDKLLEIYQKRLNKLKLY